MESYERYRSLVKEAWEQYRQGDTVKMAHSLEQSLQYTPYLRAETISDWIDKLQDFNLKQNNNISHVCHLVDSDHFISLLDKILNNETVFTPSVKKTSHPQTNDFLEKEILRYANDFGLNPQNKKFPQYLLKTLSGLGDLEKASLVGNYFSVYSIPVLKHPTQFLTSLIEKVRLSLNEKNKENLIDLDSELFFIKQITLQNNWIKQKICELLQSDEHQNIPILQQIFRLTSDCFFAKKLAYFYRKQGALTSTLELLKHIEKNTGVKDKISANIEGDIDLLKNGFPLSHLNFNFQCDNYRLQNQDPRILYVIHNSLPYKSVGYATRSHAMAQSLMKQGVQISAITRLGFPKDEIDIDQITLYDEIDQVTYHRLPTSTFFYNKIPLPEYLSKYTEDLLNFSIKYQPAIIHSASNFINGIASNHVAKILGIPSIYEIRGLWEITRSSKEPYFHNSDSFNMMKKMEVEAATNATIVVTLTEALKKEMIKRGIASEKIYVISNGADSERFIPLERDHDLEARLQYQNKVVIGYIGSVLQYEGIDYILKASAILKAKGLNNFAVLIVGDGDYLENIKLLCIDLDLEDIVTFTGRVSHQEVERYYSLVDITAYPRKGELVCEMVSPLKPFEAMSMEKCVVSSDVDALKEIVNDGITGLLHKKDDIEDLARIFELLINNKFIRIQLGKTARQWIKDEKDWQILGKKFIEIYRNLIN
jgi:glycosyltransferase involved in cell wall biosynthesis